ncbi:MAG: hypothetical protein ED555_02920 [Allomuricauda sp.]|nr:MAG: hypothetical protein ED555_02920 [Allomuricauda sp.]
MIKFFRRIRQKLLEENRFSKYLLYALGEIILVVIGILIALQINNWNEKRVRLQLEKEVVEQLIFDFTKNQEAIDYFKTQYEDSYKVIQTTLRHTGPKVEIPKAIVFDTIEQLFTPAARLLYTSNSSENTINLELLQNNSLRQNILTYQLGFDLYERPEKILVDLTLRQRKIHQKFMSLIATEQHFSPGDYPQEAFENDSLGFLRNMEFQNITVDKLYNTNEAIFYLKNVEKHNDSILKSLKKELERFK